MFVDRNVYFLFQFMITARDKGSPPRSAVNTATVSVTVKRNSHSPEFLDTPYSTVIFRTLGTSASIMQVTAADRDETVCENN